MAKELFPEPYQDEDKWIEEHSGDTDGDGIPDYRDPDMDGDGIPNWNDPDTDDDGIPNDSAPDPDKPEDQNRTNLACPW